MDYNNKIILAPMVRLGILPFRLLCLRYGADYAYCEEIIDYKMLKCERKINPATKTIDYVSSDEQYPIFQTCSSEKHAVVFQIGTCDAERALKVAKLVEKDIAAVDVNMGCPKSFSLQGGMGAALLTQPNKIRQILTTLVNGLNIPVTCKIRILPELADTLELVKLIESCGVKAVAVHGRTKFERRQHDNHDDIIAAIRDVVNIPVIANGGSKTINCRDDIIKFKEKTKANSAMIARAAMLNPSVFKPDGVLDIYSVIKEYLCLCCDYDANPAMVKYTLQLFLQYDLHNTDRGKDLLEAKSLREMCKIFDLEEYYCRQINKQNDLLHRSLRTVSSVSSSTDLSENSIDHLDDVLILPVVFERFHFKDSLTLPKTVLQNYAKKSGFEAPTFKTFVHGKFFSAVVLLNGKKFASSYKSKCKKFAEQTACFAALVALDFYESLPEFALKALPWDEIKLILPLR